MPRSLARPRVLLDPGIVLEAESRVDLAIADFLTPSTRPRGVVVTAPRRGREEPPRRYAVDRP